MFRNGGKGLKANKVTNDEGDEQERGFEAYTQACGRQIAGEAKRGDEGEPGNRGRMAWR